MSLASPSARLESWLHARGGPVSRLALAGLQIAAIAWFSPGRGLPLDDAWIHQVVARTFAESGTLGYAPGQHGAAATSYLWAALLAINFKLLHLDPSLWALMLNAACAVVAGQLLYSLLLRVRATGIESVGGRLTWRVTSFAATLVACVSPNVLWFVCSGMEAMPFVALSLGAIALATAGTERDATDRAWSALGARALWRALASGVTAGALALLRPEAAPLGGVLATWVLLRSKPATGGGAGSRRLGRAIALALPWLAMVGLYVASNVVKTGHALPSTLAGRRWLWFEASAGLSRGDRALDFLDAWATRLSSYTLDTSLASVWIFTALAGYGALCLVRSRTGPLRYAAHPEGASDAGRDGVRLLLFWTVFHASFYALLLPTPGHGGRYQPLTPLLFALCLPLGSAFALRELASVVGVPQTVRFGWFAALGLTAPLALGAPVAGALRNANALAVAHIHATELGAGRYVSGLPEGEIASFDIGGIGYASKRRVLDLGGLSDAGTAALLASGRVSEWLASNRVRWLVLPETLEPVLPVFDDFRSRLHLRDNPALRIEPVRVFETPLEKWGPAIAATWNAAPKQVVYEVTYTGQPGPRAIPMVAPDTLRGLADPSRLLSRRERVVAEHMLAVLAAWGMTLDVRVTSAPEGAARATTSGASAAISATRALGAPEPQAVARPDGASDMTGTCVVRAGWWGFDIDGCASIADPRTLRAMMYEQAGRYLDVGDLGGAIRAIPQVFAQARRRLDPSFHPSLSPLAPPTPGGSDLGSSQAARTGLALLLGALAVAGLLEAGARRNWRLSCLVRSARSLLPGRPSAALLVLMGATIMAPSIGCARPTVGRALAGGRGAVEAAIEMGASVNAEKGAHRAPLLEAASTGDAQIVALLLERGARLDARAPDGATALHLAARRGHGPAVALLVSALRAEAARTSGTDRTQASASAALDAPAGPRRRTALHDAVLAGSVESVRALVAGGGDPNRADSFGQTPLHLLASVDPSRGAMIGAALAGADPRLTDARGFTALHAAAATDDAPLLRSLAAMGPGDALSLETPTGESALDIAVRYRSDRAAEVLLLSGAVMDRDNVWPPLHDAARMDAIDRAATLLASGADERRRFRGMTALELARATGSKRVEALLDERAR